MASSRPKSFKYCSKRRKTGCRKASKKCSYRTNRTPKCQPKKKSAQKSAKNKASRKKPVNVRSSKIPMPPKKDTRKKCSVKKTKSSCTEDDCAWDPKKNPKCAPKHPSVFDQSVTFHSDKMDLHFSYPVTKHGVNRCYFVWIERTASDGSTRSYLYLRYSPELLESMKKKYAAPLKMWYLKYGEKLEQKRRTEEPDKDDAEHSRFGNPLKLSEHMFEELNNETRYMDGMPGDHGRCTDVPDDMDPFEEDEEEEEDDSRAEYSKYNIEVL